MSSFTLALCTQSTQSGISAGAALFEKRCYGCHNIGGGDKKGPDLRGVLSRHEKGWFYGFIKSPVSTNRKGDPSASLLFKKYAPEVMPDQDITDDQIDVIISFADELTRKNQSFVPSGAKLYRAVIPSDIPAGRSIFTGEKALKKGAPPCITCHHVTGLGTFGGGTLGPSLELVTAKYSDPELISILQNPSMPTMKTIFMNKPITDDELVKIFSFLQDTRLKADKVSANLKGIRWDFYFPLSSIIVIIFFIMLFGLVYKRRFMGVRKQMVAGEKL